MNFKRLEKISLLILLFVMLGAVTANASVEKVSNVTFSSNYYANSNRDVKNAFGENATMLQAHFMNHGVGEGRSASPVFDVKYYVEKNADLKKAFGKNYEAAYNHFINSGINEGRVTSPKFDVKHYLANNADVKNAFGTNYKAAYEHYMTWGIKENRVAGPDNHVYGKATVTKKATCTKTGTKVAKCQVCGKTKTTTIKKVAHDFKNGTITQQATCQLPEITKCKNCDATKETKGTTNHDFEVKTEKTCETSAIIACKNDGCDYKTEEGVSADTISEQLTETQKAEYLAQDHDFENGTVIEGYTVEATCQRAGREVRKCKNCDQLKAFNSAINPEGHNFAVASNKCLTQEVACANGCGATKIVKGTEEHTRPAKTSCDATKFTCKVCKNLVTCDPTEHEKPEGTDCTAKKYTCTKCGIAVTIPADKIGTHKEPTNVECDAATYTCEVCHTANISRTPGTHAEPDNLDCDAATYTCKNCGKENISRTPGTHVVPEGLNCTETNFQCTRCGKDATRPAGTHTFEFQPVTTGAKDKMACYCTVCGFSKIVKMEVKEPKKLSMESIADTEPYYANISKNMQAIDVAKDGDTITVTQTAEMDSYNNGHATGKWFGVLVDLGINKENLTTTGGYGIEPSDKTDAAKWGATNDNQVIIWLTDEDCGENGITINFKDSESNAEKPVTVKFVPYVEPAE